MAVMSVLAHGRPAVVAQRPMNAATPLASEQRALVDRYCVSCHNRSLKTAGLMLDDLDIDRVGVSQNRAVWEKVVRKLRAGMMPPAGSRRMERASHQSLIAWLENELDRNAEPPLA